MACNDLSLANEAIGKWKEEEPPRMHRHRQAGAKMYFFRLQISHLYEALTAVAEVSENQELKALLEQCDKQTQASFRKLEPFAKGGSERARFERIAGMIRNNIGFHYETNGKMIRKAVADRAGRAEARTSSITRGDSALLWRFNAADDIIDSIVTRQIWEVPRDTDTRAEADRIADEIHAIFLAFMDFSGEFIWRYFDE